METSKPIARAASSAQESGPAQPPEITIDPMGKELTNALTLLDDWNFLDPITPTFMVKDNSTEDLKKSSKIRHHRRSFMGCFSLRLRKDIDYEAFRKWKDNSNNKKTTEIAEIMSHYITNHYDFITTAPPSKNRDLSNYCCFNLCKSISAMVEIPFIISFQQRKQKSRHGRFASLEAEQPLLIQGWNYTGKTILFIDDFITSGMTAKACFEVLRGRNNHIDGLIYCEY